MRTKKARGRPKGSTKKGGKIFRIPAARCSMREYSKFKFLVRQYAGGNASLWILYAVLEAPPRVLK